MALGQLLRSYARLADDAKLRDQLGRGAGELAQILPELRERLSDLPEPPSSDSESARFRLFDATTEFLRKVAAAQPVVLVLDDLHAADAPSLLLLQFLTRELDSIRVLVLAALRDVDPVPGQPLTALLTEVAREPGTRRLSLRGLSEAEVADYLEQTASAIASPRLAAALHEETEGNPFFVVETVQLLALEGVSPRSAGTGIAMPQSVRDVISRRFAHLSTGCKRVLVLASVLGREFEPAALARVEGKRESTILDAVREAAAAGVVTNVPDAAGRYRFAHVLIRDALYEGLTMERRIGLHLDVVGALATQHGEEPGPHLAELAHHSIAGRDFEKGFDYATRAGDWALELLAYEEAARLYEVALDALARSNLRDEAAGCELLLSLGESHARAGDIPTAKRVFWQAAEAARELGAARQLALAAFGYGGRSMYGRAGDDDRLVPLLEEALTALGDSDVALRARLAARLAGALRDEPSRRRRDRLSSEAIEYARAAGDLSALAYALDGRAAAVMAPDTVAECFLLATELRDIAIGMGDQERVVHGHLHRLIAQVMQGDLDGAKADLEAMSRLADELRQPADFWQVAAAEAMLGLAMGRLDEAQELIDHAFAVGERSEPAMAIPVYRLQRYTLFDFLGRLEEVEPELRELVDAYPARTAMRCALVHLTARLGRTDEAGQMLAELAEDDFATLKFDNEWLFGMSLLAETCAMLGEAEPAMVLYQAGLPWASLNVLDHPEVVRGSVSRYLALLAATAGRWDEAAAHFEAAIELNGRMGLRPWLAHTQVDYARLLFARGELGLQGLAYELQEEALATYAALGMDTAVASGATRDTRSVLRLVD